VDPLMGLALHLFLIWMLVFALFVVLAIPVKH
jgi:hypothetical protein